MKRSPNAPITVIIPCFLCRNTLQRALCSIEGQTAVPSEIILINDGNPVDEKARITEICAESALAPIISIIHLEQQQGPGAARNIGWNNATQEFIAFLDADDAWHPRKLELQFGYMRKNPQVDICGHQIKYVNAINQISKLFLQKDLPVSKVTPMQILLSNKFSTPTIMIKRDMHLRFSNNKKYSEDYQLWMEFILNGLEAVLIKIPLAFVFKPVYGAGGLSGDMWNMEKGELDAYRSVFKKGLISGPVLLCVFVLSLLKYVKRMMLRRLNKQHSFVRSPKMRK